jgi:hypothetical protein
MKVLTVVGVRNLIGPVGLSLHPGLKVFGLYDRAHTGTVEDGTVGQRRNEVRRPVNGRGALPDLNLNVGASPSSTSGKEKSGGEDDEGSLSETRKERTDHKQTEGLMNKCWDGVTYIFLR